MKFTIIGTWLFGWTAVLSAGTVNLTVLGTDNPFYAGQTQLDGTGPATYPGLPLIAGDALKFTVTGSVSYSGPATDSPDGAAIYSTGATGTGISNVSGPLNALYGVFLGLDAPTDPAPASLDFSDGGLGLAFVSLYPELQQIFFIGDGLTGDGTGSIQQFIVPTGATRLYFGMLDGSGWYNNEGSFSVTIDNPAVTGEAGTPEPGSVMVVGTGLLAVYLKRRKRI